MRPKSQSRGLKVHVMAPSFPREIDMRGLPRNLYLEKSQ